MVTTLILTLTRIVVSALVTFMVTRRVSHRPTLVVRLEPSLFLSPEDLDVHGGLSLSVGRHKVRNICVLLLEVHCKGEKDIDVADAEPPRGPNSTPLPRLDFRDFRIVGIRTLNNDRSRFYVPISRHSGDQGLYVNIHHLGAGATAQFQIVGELENDRTEFAADQCMVFRGAIPNTNFDTSGTIARPWLRS